MTQLLNVSRAARLAGVTRSEIQKKIHSGELKTFEGEVKITDLLRVFPELDLDHDPTIEQIELIKARAKPKFPWQQSEPPSVEILLTRLQTLKGLLVETKSSLDRNIALLQNVDERLEELSQDDSLDKAAQGRIVALREWLAENQDRGELEPDDAAVLFTRNMLLHVIAPSVQIVPSGHEYLTDGSDTVLDGAIKSGFNVKYGCSNATCGGCKARVISGQVLETRSPEYELSAHEQKLGYMLMCCNTAVTDLVIEAGETLSPVDLPRQSVDSTVANLQPLSQERYLLRLKAAEEQNFRFFAGQKATLTMADGSARTLPIFSCPCDRENLNFIVDKHDTDTAPDVIFSGLVPGAKVLITGPEGDFVLRDASTNPSLFITYDDGFIPVRSLIEHAISIDRIETFHIYRYGSPDTPVHFHNLCRSWQDALDNFTYRALESEPNPNVDISAIVADIPDLSRFDAYIAGPESFVGDVERMLIKHGLHDDRLSIEITTG